MLTVNEVAAVLEELAPERAAADWDNVGLQLGDPHAPVNRIMVALTVTEDVVEQAIREKIDLLVSHHPFIFKPQRSIRYDTGLGRVIKKLVLAGISVYVAHTNLDAVAGGLNDWLAARLGLQDVEPLVSLNGEETAAPTGGFGRVGQLPETVKLADLAVRTKQVLNLTTLRYVGDPEELVQKVAVCSGSGGDFAQCAAEKGAEVLVTGDVKYHTAVDALTVGLPVIDAGHFGTEIIVAEKLMEYLNAKLTEMGHHPAVLRAREVDPFSFL